MTNDELGLRVPNTQAPPEVEPTHILLGVAGSQAHGLSTPESDEDRLGVFSYPTEAFWYLSKPAESIVRTSPDYSAHELEKFCRLAAKSNPTVLEVLHLDCYDYSEPMWAERLLEIRGAFLSAPYVKNAYLGYAHSQFLKLQNKDKTVAYSDTKAKGQIRKHAKHLLRLLETGHRLYTRGVLQVRVDNPDWYRRVLDEWPLALLADYAQQQITRFEDADTILPDEPYWETINTYLRDYRKAH